MHGSLHIRVAADNGRTHVVESYGRAPFHYLPPSYTAGPHPLLTIVNSSGGILGGDVLDAHLELGPGCALALRTQAATKVYRSDRGAARSHTRFELAAGALLDYFPDEIIPFAGSNYIQETEIDLAEGATAVLAEMVTAGRLARNECFAFTRLALDLRCNVGGALRLRDRCDLRPSAQRFDDPAILGAALVWGSFYLLTEQPLAAGFVEAVDDALHSVADGDGGATAGPLGLLGRVVGRSLEPVREALQRARSLVLESTLGRFPSQGVLGRKSVRNP